MIDRYTRPEMAQLWSLDTKYRAWLQVELAILWARWQDGQIPADVYRLIERHAKVDVKRVTYLDEGAPEPFHHDMNAFVEAVKEKLRGRIKRPAVIAAFHDRVTSYDVEDSAYSLILGQSAGYLLNQLRLLREELINQARAEKETYMMGLTHGQAAEIITLAVKLLNYVDILDRDIARLEREQENLKIGRLAGAVGTYAHLGPKVEALVCQRLGLRPAKISTQIIHRDIHAAYLQAVALLACNLEHIAHNLWLMCAFPRLEAHEPFGRKQRGSSQMPHKKNPITLERMRGMAAIIRGNVNSYMEMVATYDERAIDQSCVERVACADAITIVHYMLCQLTRIVKGMQFSPERMTANIALTRGQISSAAVKDVLFAKGINELSDGNEVLPTYVWVQRAAQIAWDEGRHLYDVVQLILLNNGVTQNELDACFDTRVQLRHLPEIYERFEI